MADFTRSTAGFLGIRTTIKHGQLYTAGPVFLFFNHRSWTDFFLDQVVCEQHAHVSTLSRMFVYWGIPFASSFLNLDKNLLFFRRGASSQDEMNAVIDRHFAEVPLSCMIVYPEGTRNPGLVEMPLKTGMMRVAFRKRIPVQIVMTSNKEKAMREKPSYSAQYGVECETVYGDLVRPDAFADADAFIVECNAAWRRAAAVLNAPTTPAERATHRKVDLWPAARHMNAKAALVAVLLVALAAALWMRPCAFGFWE
jgi:hypothetical protein